MSMKLKRDARTLKRNAIASLRRGLEVFNSHDDSGRTEAVLLSLQHACEMLVKAVLLQKGQKIFDAESGRSIGLEKAINASLSLKYMSQTQAGAIRSLDAMRDAAQHWMIVVPEEMLYLSCRAVITALDELLQSHLADSLADNLPLRVLPLSTLPIQDFDVLVDREYGIIKELLAPNKRSRDEARGRIRALLAMEGHVSDIITISERDIDRIERAIRADTDVAEVFPRLRTVASTAGGEGFTYKVHFTKKEGLAVRFVASDDPAAAAAIREIDLQRKYHMAPAALAQKLNLTPPKCKALRDYLQIDQNPANMVVFEFGATKHPRYSDNAFNLLRDANTPEMITAAWQAR